MVFATVVVARVVYGLVVYGLVVVFATVVVVARVVYGLVVVFASVVVAGNVVANVSNFTYKYFLHVCVVVESVPQAGKKPGTAGIAFVHLFPCHQFSHGATYQYHVEAIAG